MALALAICAEVAGTLALKASDGMSKVGPTSVVVIGYGIAFYLLSEVVKSVPLGVAYAIWSGAGVALIVILSAVFYRQIPDAPALIGIGLIVAGVIVIQLYSKLAGH